MKNEKYLSCLKSFVSENSDLSLYLLGTGNLMIQGVDIMPNDIDFLVNRSTIKKISDRYKSKLHKNITGYWETEFNFRNMDIHLVTSEGNPVRQYDPSENSVIKRVGDVDVSCIRLETEKNAYIEMNRPKDINKVELINKALTS